MSGYRIKLSPQAVNTLQSFDQAVMRNILMYLKRNAAQAVKTSRVSQLPEPPGFQVFDFSIQIVGENLRVRALFRYFANEEELFIEVIVLG